MQFNYNLNNYKSNNTTKMIMLFNLDNQYLSLSGIKNENNMLDNLDPAELYIQYDNKTILFT